MLKLFGPLYGAGKKPLLSPPAQSDDLPQFAATDHSPCRWQNVRQNLPPLLLRCAAPGLHESAKLDLLLDLIQELVEENRHVLVFSQFTSMLAFIEEKLQALHIQYGLLTGKKLGNRIRTGLGDVVSGDGNRVEVPHPIVDEKLLNVAHDLQ